jgi:hypothetical protein
MAARAGGRRQMPPYDSISCQFPPHSAAIPSAREALRDAEEASETTSETAGAASEKAQEASEEGRSNIRRRVKKSSKEQLMKSKNAAGTAQNTRRTDTGLDSQYGEIGISAVAAALQYKSKTKNTANAAPRPDNKWFAELAA